MMKVFKIKRKKNRILKAVMVTCGAGWVMSRNAFPMKNSDGFNLKYDTDTMIKSMEYVISMLKVLSMIAVIGMGILIVWILCKKHIEKYQCTYKNKKHRGAGFRKIKELDEIDGMEGHDFEYYCADVLNRIGYHHVEVTRGAGDFGIDVIAYKGKVKYGIQCKNYSGTVGWKAVEEAHAGGAYYNCDKVAVMTNSLFTRQAVEGATKIGVELWDREWFAKRL